MYDLTGFAVQKQNPVNAHYSDTKYTQYTHPHMEKAASDITRWASLEKSGLLCPTIDRVFLVRNILDWLQKMYALWDTRETDTEGDLASACAGLASALKVVYHCCETDGASSCDAGKCVRVCSSLVRLLREKIMLFNYSPVWNEIVRLCTKWFRGVPDADRIGDITYAMGDLSERISEEIMYAFVDAFLDYFDSRLYLWEQETWPAPDSQTCCVVTAIQSLGKNQPGFILIREPRFVAIGIRLLRWEQALPLSAACPLTHSSVLPPEMGVEVPDSRIFPLKFIVFFNDRKVRRQMG